MGDSSGTFTSSTSPFVKLEKAKLSYEFDESGPKVVVSYIIIVTVSAKTSHVRTKI